MGPCTANARRPTVVSRCQGTTVSCCVADLRLCLPTTSVTGVQQSKRSTVWSLAVTGLLLSLPSPTLYIRGLINKFEKHTVKYFHLPVRFISPIAYFLRIVHKIYHGNLRHCRC